MDNLQKLAKKADRVILATDEDREGEAIAWHLIQALELDQERRKRKQTLSASRSTRSRKTRSSSALEHPRALDINLGGRPAGAARA